MSFFNFGNRNKKKRSLKRIIGEWTAAAVLTSELIFGVLPPAIEVASNRNYDVETHYGVSEENLNEHFAKNFRTLGVSSEEVRDIKIFLFGESIMNNDMAGMFIAPGDMYFYNSGNSLPGVFPNENVVYHECSHKRYFHFTKKQKEEFNQEIDSYVLSLGHYDKRMDEMIRAGAGKVGDEYYRVHNYQKFYVEHKNFFEEKNYEEIYALLSEEMIYRDIDAYSLLKEKFGRFYPQEKSEKYDFEVKVAGWGDYFRLWVNQHRMLCNFLKESLF